MTYNIVESTKHNDSRYKYLARHLNCFFEQNGWEQNFIIPKYVFLIGDAVNPYNESGKCFHVIFLSDLHTYYKNIAFKREPYLIVRDFDANITIPSRIITRIVSYPLPVSVKVHGEFSSINRIFVSCHELFCNDSTILKLLRPLNRLSNVPVLLDSRKEDIVDCVNDNISLVDTEDKLDSFVGQSDLVLGSGAAIVEALIQKKKFIIAGETGYGGIPDNRNIHRFSELFFQGSIGGRLFDPIPEDLVLDDIMGVENGMKCDIPDDTINNLSDKIFNEWIGAIHYFENYDEYKFNPDHTIVCQASRHYVLNRYNRKKIAEISSHEAMALSKNQIEMIDKIQIENLKRLNILISF